VPRDDGGSGTSDWVTIQVNLADLAAVADSIEAAVNANLRPHADKVSWTYRCGATFGNLHPSNDLTAARRKYQDCLDATVAQLGAFVQASTILVNAARQVVERYGTADALAAASALDVQAALDKAANDAASAHAAAEAAAIQAAAEARNSHIQAKLEAVE
jgi:hypothetical protein